MYGEGILVLDFGGHDGRILARRMRGEQVFCTILPIDAPISEIRAHRARGLIIAGDGQDAFAKGAARVPEAVHALGLPMLGVGYGARALLRGAGAKLRGSEFGAQARSVHFEAVPLFEGLERSDRTFERFDDIALPMGVCCTASTDEGQCVAFENTKSRIWGMQFLPEANDPDGLMILRNFARNICGVESRWTMKTFLDWSVERISAQAGEGKAMIALSGGVDSAVCAVLMHQALGERLSCVHVDTGMMRAGEHELIQRYFSEKGIELRVINASPRFLSALSGLSESKQKREAVYREYKSVVSEVLAQMGEGAVAAQGTIYTDILDEPEVYDQGAAFIEPLRLLFKEEVRELGRMLGLPEELCNRQAFPGPGLALRCMGAVTAKKLEILRKADQIFREEVISAGIDKRIRQYFAVLTDTSTLGADGYGHTIVLRAVNTGAAPGAFVFRMPYDLLERTCERITQEVSCVNRVVYDMTNAPPALVEWE